MSPEQAWDLIWTIVGGGAVVALVLVFGVPIANVVRNKLYERRMRRHFSNTRGRRGRAKDRGRA